MPRAAVLVALALAAMLQGCSREPVRTRVEPPRNSLPDDTVLRPGAPATALRPKPPGAATSGESSIARTEPVPRAAAPSPRAGGPLPAVPDPGDPLGAELLAQRPLQVPVVGIPPARLVDGYQERRGKRRHEAIDILAPAGTSVVAVDDGRIAKLFTSKAGGLTIYHYDPTGRLAYYYAHLQGYAPGLREGQEVKRGEVIGYVGVTGNSAPDTPHLHFAVFRLGDPPKWWRGEAVNPYPALSRAAPSEQVATR